MAKEVTVVNTPATSKINWTQFVGAAAMLASYFGLDIPAEMQVQIVMVIGLVTQGLTWVLRTWFTNKSPSVG